ncbi:hypothetical protein HMPREF0063_12287 [Aeromicrobium marinum DSM 15272]|uniref:Bacterial transcriptional activator domain-containing protein n=1 Tax=Aeromicrobium marinum DSM 15272 TaxID=585531 RepID=E2SCX5_9ACTN|nr:hypothetical protein [Aeromicrobium marinum]EFQ83078.1 hypothetical protein HMPREF0063_12287 [Aeromicrobium marinum DSM 15272]
MTEPSTHHEPVSTDPARFARPARTAPPPRRRGLEVVGSLLALLGLVVGVPAVLIALSGPPPIPTSVPSARDFAQQLSVEDLVMLLVAVVWLAWLYFLVCVAVEVVAARRGGLARTVPLAGPLQKLAQVLVGTLLLTGLMATSAQAATTDHAPAPAHVASAVVEADAPTPAPDTATETAAQESDLADQKVYTVKAPNNGYHDNLWDIAENHLGSGLRYKEIYELNKDRVQADGRQLELARLIQPGWELVMPADALGIAPVAAPDAAPAPPAPTPVDGAVEPGDAGSTDLASDGSGVQGAWSGGAGLVAAGVIAALALRRRSTIGRRPDDEARVVEDELLVAATLRRATGLDRVLRSLAADCRRAAVGLPPVYAVVVDERAVELRLAPAVPEAVDGWTVDDEGRVWRRELTDDVSGTVDDIAPYPGLVSLGVDDDGRDVLVDLEAAGGVISLGGDPSIAAEIAASIAVQAATAPWARTMAVIASDLPDDLRDIAPDRLTSVDDLGAALADLEARVDGLREDVLTGRMRRRSPQATHLVVAGSRPTPEVSERLSALAGDRRQSLSVVVAGAHPAARWRLHVDEHGSLTVPALDLTLAASRISPAQASGIAELFTAAEDARPDATDRVEVQTPLRRHVDADWSTAGLRVGVLGVLTVQGTGDLPADRAAVATELTTYLALHPEGVHPTVLAGVLWPRGVTADVRDATIERARAWLGSAPDGSHVLRADADGRLSLSDDVVCDWDCLRNLLVQAHGSSTTRDETEHLRRALKLVRGEAFAGVPEGRYGWVARDDTARTILGVVVDASLRLAALAGDDGDHPGVVQAAEAGLRAAAANQALWRVLLRARHAESGVAGVQKTLDEMSVALHGLALEPETEALVEELLPSSGSLASGS